MGSAGDSLEQRTLADLSRMLGAGEATSERLVRYYIDRIESIDQRERSTNAIMELNPDALQIARERDAARAEGKARGALDGVPIVIKDNIDTDDAMLTTAGSWALADSRPAQDASLVTRLREEGAVILGKTNLSEWANIRSTRSVSGWSARGGLTRNPHALDRSASGSSSGSGAAVAADFCAAAIGTETNGSIIGPASTNGVVGLKPTVGLVSRAGIVPISHSQDTAGPMTRCVEDAALLLNALARADVRDPATEEAGEGRVADYAAHLDPDALQGARLGVARALFGRHPGVVEAAEKTLRLLQDLGATLVDPVVLEAPRERRRDSFEVLLWELKSDIAAYLATRTEGSPRTLAELIAYNAANSDAEMPYFGQEIFVQAEQKGELTDEAYVEALASVQRSTREEGIDAAIARHDLDALVSPSSALAWSIDLVNGDARTGGPSAPWYPAIAGYPHITVPLGNVYGLPLGLSFFAGAWQEARLIELAYAFEQATRARRVPGMVSSLDLA